MFRNDQRKFYKELDGKMNVQNEENPKESTEFWSKLWSEPVEHNRDSEWLKNVQEKLRDKPKQENIIITAKESKQAIARVLNWKAAGTEEIKLVDRERMKNLDQEGYKYRTSARSDHEQGNEGRYWK